MHKTTIEVNIDCNEWYLAGSEIVEICKKTILTVLNSELTPITSPSDEISILLTTDEQMGRLNKCYRGENKPTNVLSFASGSKTVKDIPVFLGDIAIGYSIAREESIKADIPLIDHIQHLLIHGCLHILGFDHENDIEAKKMENIEITILKNLGIDNPYQTLLST
jgi:probable rRNA maturation factor